MAEGRLRGGAAPPVSDDAWLEFVADFGHAKHFFPDADVFPSVVTVRKPLRGLPPPEESAICVIPRDSVPRRGLEAAVTEATFSLPRAMFTKEAWVLEPRPVMDLLDKIRRNGVPLAKFVGRSPIKGIKSGLNEAFVVEHTVAARLIVEDPKSRQLIRPFRRGQDVERWVSPQPGLHMIALSSRGAADWPWSGMDEQAAEAVFRDEYPALYRHLSGFRHALVARESRGKSWWEAQTAANPEAYGRDAIIYQEIQFHPCYSVNEAGVLSNNKTFIIPSHDRYLLAVLNSPIMWWHNWRFLPHMKDEALSPMSFRMERLPIAPANDRLAAEFASTVEQLISRKTDVATACHSILDWLRHEFGLEKPGQALAQPHLLDADGFVAAPRKALPKSRRFSAADVARLKQEHATTLGPARAAADKALALERRLSDLVNAAYGLTPEEVQLMWDTAPPRMPFQP